jgi:hypothetical protein
MPRLNEGHVEHGMQPSHLVWQLQLDSRVLDHSNDAHRLGEQGSELATRHAHTDVPEAQQHQVAFLEASALTALLVSMVGVRQLGFLEGRRELPSNIGQVLRHHLGSRHMRRCPPLALR